MAGGNKIENVYFYALYDEADQQAHSGLIADACEAAVREDIRGNYIKPRHVTVRRIPELLGVVDEKACTVEILPRKQALAKIRFTLDD